MAEESANSNFLSSLLNKNIRVNTSDGRLFWGQFKCTDPASPTFSILTISPADVIPPFPPFPPMRQPKSNLLNFLQSGHTNSPAGCKHSSISAAAAASSPDPTAAATGRILLDMQSRYLGLVVLPGQHITKIQEELFASQLRRGGGGGSSDNASAPTALT
ncbi:lsm domain-containing protein [Zalerion maritima]|uniref:Lsm domain-containing protein n=1 Tax=Zalerion maritima TaxID=339359 RepID=A0AAD5RNU8_9PEZI|nr:lsm domain-containing protein [Zalerion maritima]